MIEGSEWKNVTVNSAANELLESWKSEPLADADHATPGGTCQEDMSGVVPTKKIKTRTIRLNDKLHQIVDVTKDLVYISKEKVEKGGFGTVQPGRLKDGTEVAIKRFRLNGKRNFDRPISMLYSKVRLSPKHEQSSITLSKKRFPCRFFSSASKAKHSCRPFAAN